MRNTYYMVGIERNKDPDLTPKERNTSYFVLLDDRKHGRSGKFPVFYDIDTGDYLEPPEGFLESECQTLREWYNIHPEDDPANEEISVHKRPKVDAFLPLSEENLEGLTEEHYEITEDQIPDGPASEPEEAVTETVVVTEVVEPSVVPINVQVVEEENDWDTEPPF